MKFLQHICLGGCQNLVKLPANIVKLQKLRYLSLDNTCINSVPRGFCALTNMRALYGFPVHVDGDWCSLEELGPLLQLMEIGLKGLENVSATLSATKARLGAKMHLSLMGLYCSSRLGDDGLVKDGVTEKDQGIIEKVFDELYPPPYMEDIRIGGYFGRQLPRWMMSTTMEPLESLRILSMIDLACCTQLPDGLCQLPCLEFLNVNRAPAIKRVGPEFVQPYSCRHHASSQVEAAFLRLRDMALSEIVEWEEWNWEEEVQAMPVLEVLLIQRCKLRCLPPGLSTHARTLRKLSIYNVQRLHSLDNFAFVVELTVDNIPELTRISNLPKLQKLEINCCRKFESLQKMTALRRLMLTIQHSEKQLPLYLQTVQPSHLLLDCSPEILTSISVGKFGPEFDKFSHIEKVEACSKDGDNVKKWYVYTSEPYNMSRNMEKHLQDLSVDDEE